MNPLLSIVVPTKNRHFYLEFFVRYFHSINSEKIELVIQDNSDLGTNEDFIAFLKTIKDNRILYTYTNENLSVVENCDHAIANSKGEFVTLIGDDDIFSKHLIDYVEICKAKSIDALLPVKGTYTWPDVQPRFYKKNLSGIFRITNFSGKSKKLDVNSIQKKVLKLGEPIF
jgi:glycosyltransferase involved in cell wall biosynthesis